MKSCPACQREVQSEASECPYCGVVFAKWRSPSVIFPKEPDTATQEPKTKKFSTQLQSERRDFLWWWQWGLTPMQRYVVVVAVGLLLYLAYTYIYLRPRVVLADVPANPTATPSQISVEGNSTVDVMRDGKAYQVTKMFAYEVSGQVLMTKRYSITYASDFYHVDLALVWGDRIEDILREYRFFQMGRWLFWRTDKIISQAERAYITEHISNNHLIPAEGNTNIDRAIRWIRSGDLVTLKGYLVSIKGLNHPFSITSSTTRTDSGDGACEIVWVEEIKIGSNVYR